MPLDSKIPGGPLAEKWDRHRFESKLVNPANRRKYTIIIVGTGLAGASAASSLGELGYNVLSFCIHDSPRRAHSIAAQGGINAAKNYQNDGDSIQRLFYDTIKGGDYRSREANVYRLAQTSVSIIDQCVAQGVPFAREYGGLLDNRSFGGAQVSRTFYARGQTGQQLLLGAYQSMMRQVEKGTVTSLPNREMLDVVVVNGQARGVVCRNLLTGSDRALRRACRADLHRRLRHGLLPVDECGELERHRGMARPQARRLLRQPLLHADSSHLHPRLGHASVEADADERKPAQRRPRVGAQAAGGQPPARADSRGRARLLPRTALSKLRQPRAARRRLAQRQGRLRRRQRRRRKRAGGVPGFRRVDQAPRRGRHQDALRQPVRHVHEDHRRRSVPDADADLPGDSLHDGRVVGGLQPDEHDPRPARPRRGELLGSRGQSPGRQCPDAGARRRLLRHSLHARPLSRQQRAAGGQHRPRRVPRGRGFGAGAHRHRCSPCAARRRRASSIESSGSCCGTKSAWRATKPA